MHHQGPSSCKIIWFIENISLKEYLETEQNTQKSMGAAMKHTASKMASWKQMSPSLWRITGPNERALGHKAALRVLKLSRTRLEPRPVLYGVVGAEVLDLVFWLFFLTWDENRGLFSSIKCLYMIRYLFHKPALQFIYLSIWLLFVKMERKEHGREECLCSSILRWKHGLDEGKMAM